MSGLPVLVTVVLVSVGFSSGGQLRGCLNNKIDINEEADTVITCDDFYYYRTIEWKVGGVVVAICLPSTDYCENRSMDFHATRGKWTVFTHLTELKLLENHRQYAGMTLECHVVDGKSDSCDIRIFHLANLSRCESPISTDVKTWTVRGSCIVDQLYDSGGDYWCSWMFRQVLHGRFERDFTNYTDSTTGLEYMRGTCSFSASLPTQTGNFQYMLHVEPGPQEQPYGNIAIYRPTGLHAGTIPTYILEGSALTTECRATQPGSPPASPAWVEMGGEKLNVNITRDDDNKTCTCQLMWGAGQIAVELETKHQTLRVAYGPTSCVISGPESATNNHPVTLTCTTDAANPSPTFHWIGIACENQTADSTTGVCTFTPTETDNGTTVRCTASNSHFDSLSATAEYTLYLPANTDNPDLPGSPGAQGLAVGVRVASMVGGLVAAVVVVVVAIIVVFMVRRRSLDLFHGVKRKHNRDCDTNSSRHAHNEYFKERVNVAYVSSDEVQLTPTNLKINRTPSPHGATSLCVISGKTDVHQNTTPDSHLGSVYSSPVDSIEDGTYTTPTTDVYAAVNKPEKQRDALTEEATYYDPDLTSAPTGDEHSQTENHGHNVERCDSYENIQSASTSSGYVVTNNDKRGYENVNPGNVGHDSHETRVSPEGEPHDDYNTLCLKETRLPTTREPDDQYSHIAKCQ